MPASENRYTLAAPVDSARAANRISAASSAVGRPGTIAVRSACITNVSTWGGSTARKAVSTASRSSASRARPAVVSAPPTTSPNVTSSANRVRTRSSRVGSARRGACQRTASTSSSTVQAPGAEAKAASTSRRSAGKAGAASATSIGRSPAPAPATARGRSSHANSRSAYRADGSWPSHRSNASVGSTASCSPESAATSPAAAATSIARAVTGSDCPTARAVRLRSRCAIPPVRTRAGGASLQRAASSSTAWSTSRTAPTALASMRCRSPAAAAGVGGTSDATGSCLIDPPSAAGVRRIVATSAGTTARSAPSGTTR